ncbi:protein transport protein sec1-like [Teratosphaeria destructans]|uniref:Protein transport protein sec1-like n=1 Tax=Teratosphaeria destructans TaxID=418781 RepID=A0A9W7SJ08_9PEZI|nr:protein transport protein sec1-like [Teratosphaeria destructans]
MASIIDAQRNILLKTIRHITRGDWKVLVLDADSKRLVDNVLDQDTILNENITNIEQITDRRPTNRDVDAVYLLTPRPFIVDCLMADFEKRKYRKAHLVWTSLPHPAQRDRIDQSNVARSQIALFQVLNVDFFPRESHMVTFRDPWSFPTLFHPACNHLVRQHMEDIAQKIVGVCVALGEYPIIRYYRPRAATHEASILCSHLARFAQDELDLYAKFHEDFPPPTTRPRGTLYITDRSMDLFAPFLHEFTYQAMAHDLLQIREGDKISFRAKINEGSPNEEVKDIEITERDKIWVENRHRHMAMTIDKLMADFQRFMKDNPNFTKESQGGANSLNAIKDMMAGLPQFQEQKEAYALHLSMAQESMNKFQAFRLLEVGGLEQILATGLDEDYKKPKGVADQLIRMLDEPEVVPPDRLRLLIQYVLFRDGILAADMHRLLAHAQLPPQDEGIIRNLELIGAITSRGLKDKREPRPPLFPRKPPPVGESEIQISRYEPVLQNVLEAHAAGNLDSNLFQYTKPPLDLGEMGPQPSATSLRSAKPTWAKTRAGNVGAENRQRVIVFLAGGATYSESRACYDVGRATGREIFLVTSHMLTPQLFIRQVGDLSAHRSRLGLPAEAPKPQVPAHLLEPDEVPKPPPQAQQRNAAQPPTAAMGAMNLNGSKPNGPRPNGAAAPVSPQPLANSSAKLQKDAEREKEKKRHRFGFGKKDKH